MQFYPCLLKKVMVFCHTLARVLLLLLSCSLNGFDAQDEHQSTAGGMCRIAGKEFINISVYQ